MTTTGTDMIAAGGLARLADPDRRGFEWRDGRLYVWESVFDQLSRQDRALLKYAIIKMGWTIGYEPCSMRYLFTPPLIDGDGIDQPKKTS